MIALGLNKENGYTDGAFFFHGRTEYCNYPAPDPSSIGTIDMVFQIQFCAASTPTLPMTWGRVKSTYR